MRDHHHIDERSLAFGHAIAAKLRSEPEIVDRGRATLARWMTTCAPSVRPALQEWCVALDGPVDAVIAILTSADERAIRLRQSNPFAGVLSQGERNRILRQFEAHDARAT